MASIHKLKVGQRLYTVTRSRMGNTTLRTVHVHDVVVKEIDPDYGFVVATWNYNAPRRYYPGEIATWKVSKPVTVEGFFGSRRLANKAEKAEIMKKLEARSK
jgi:hypothetical protein